MAMPEERFSVGTFEGTGAALNVKCGFKPRYVRLYNLDATNPIVLEWWHGMTAGHGLKDSDSTRSRITSNGITQYAGTDTQGDGEGFTVGTDSVNANGETVFYLAVR